MALGSVARDDLAKPRVYPRPETAVRRLFSSPCSTLHSCQTRRAHTLRSGMTPSRCLGRESNQLTERWLDDLPARPQPAHTLLVLSFSIPSSHSTQLGSTRLRPPPNSSTFRLSRNRIELFGEITPMTRRWPTPSAGHECSEECLADTANASEAF